MTCDNCLHYSSSPIRKGYGHCHRKSPTADATGKAVWPMVYQTDWCGEYIPMSLRKPDAAMPAADGWIEWNGGKCPVDGERLVDVTFRDGEYFCSQKACHWNWQHDNNRQDIMYYRLSKGGKA